MESMYAIYTEPRSLIEPGPVGKVLAQSYHEAWRRAARVIKIGFDICVIWSGRS